MRYKALHRNNRVILRENNSENVQNFREANYTLHIPCRTVILNQSSDAIPSGAQFSRSIIIENTRPLEFKSKLISKIRVQGHTFN